MYTPIAIKSFGIDTETGLNKELQIKSVFSDAKSETITIYYDVVLLSPTNVSVSVIKTGTYIRTGIKFTTLRNSQIGQGITALIESDLDMIQDYNSIDDDLKQTSF